MELRPSLKMGKSKCAKSPISYLTTAPPEFETFKLLLMAVALPYRDTYSNPTFTSDQTSSVKFAPMFSFEFGIF